MNRANSILPLPSCHLCGKTEGSVPSNNIEGSAATKICDGCIHRFLPRIAKQCHKCNTIYFERKWHRNSEGDPLCKHCYSQVIAKAHSPKSGSSLASRAHHWTDDNSW